MIEKIYKVSKSLLIITVCIFIACGCTSDKKITKINSSKINNNETVSEEEEMNSLNIIINDNTYILDLEDNETAKSFINMLPLNITMNELNSNEKYVYLDDVLPTNESNSKHINAGDVMLFGNNCLVIFYKSFDTSYSYTKIGHINNLPDLGKDSITVTINK